MFNLGCRPPKNLSTISITSKTWLFSEHQERHPVRQLKSKIRHQRLGLINKDLKRFSKKVFLNIWSQSFFTWSDASRRRKSKQTNSWMGTEINQWSRWIILSVINCKLLEGAVTRHRTSKRRMTENRPTIMLIFFVVIASHELVLDGFDQLSFFALPTL